MPQDKIDQYHLEQLATSTALRESIGTRETLDKVNSFEGIISVYECTDDPELKDAAIKKLDSNEWFEDIDDSQLNYLATYAPHGSKTKKRAERLHSARMGHY